MATKQKSGLYRAKVKVGNDKDGKPVYKYISGRTKKELEQARKDVQEHYIEGVGVVSDVLYGVYLQQWYDTYKKDKIAPSTRKNYGIIMNKYMIPEFGDRNLRAIGAMELQTFLNTKFSGKSSTMSRIAITIMRGVFMTAARDKIVTENVSMFIERPEASQPKEKYVINADERTAITKLCETEEYGLMLAVLYYTGMRSGEMLALQWGDIDLQNNLIHIQRGVDPTTNELRKLKTKTSNRLVPIPKPLRDMLLKQPRGIPSMMLFPGITHEVFSRETFKVLFRDMMEKIGLKGKVTPHSLRHNYITLCYESGIDCYTASRLAGHSNIKTTMNIYTHLSQSQMKTISTKVEDMFTGKKITEGCTKVAQNQANPSTSL